FVSVSVSLYCLTSFPTRRSSDLQPSSARSSPRRTRWRTSAPLGRADDLQVRVARQALRLGEPVLGAPVSGRLEGRDQRRVAPGADRKSTRLNSSHVKISYAGFCL